jgi:hypothetical protein
MALPKQVEEAGKKADEELATLFKVDEKTDKAPVEPEPTVKEPEAPPKTEDDENSETWKHKFNVLQGKYNKEIGAAKDTAALETENRNLRDQISRLSLQVSDLTTVTTDLEAKLKEPEKKGVLTEEDLAHLEKEDLGGKTLDIINRLIDSRVAAGTEPLKKRVDTTEKTAKQTAEETRAQTFSGSAKDGIRRATGMDYETINVAPEFAAWLNAVVPYTGGKTRRMIGEDAVKASDVATYVQLFDDFVKETGFGKAPEPKKEKKKDPLETEIEPTTTPDDPAVPDFQPGKVYTSADVKKFYDDAAKGRYRGREDEYKKIDADILKAHGEPGRPRIKP